MTIPTGFVKSTIQAPSAARARTCSAMSSTTGNGAERLREAARAGRLLADAAAGERQRLVREPRRLAADADLDEHEVGAVDRAVEVAGELERSRESDTLEHPARERADDRQPLGVDVVQHELADVERRETRTRAPACTSSPRR